MPANSPKATACRAWYARNRERVLAEAKAKRQGPEGDAVRALERAYQAARGDAARERWRRYETDNREQRAARCSAYYEKNREAILARAKARREGERGKRQRAVERAWYQKNAARLIAKMRAGGYTSQRAWKAKNPEAVREYTQRRNARVKGASIGVVDYRAIWRESGGICGICRQPIRVYDEIHFDHIVPLARGGAHSKDNLQVAHARCNMAKGAKELAA